MTRGQAAELLLTRTAQVGRWCGFDLLKDEPHGLWLRDFLFGKEDMTLLAHRGSCKTTCVSLAIAAIMAVRPNANLMFFRKTEADAEEVLKQVGRICESDVFKYLTNAMWGAPAVPVRQNRNELTLNIRRSPRGAAELTAFGTGASVTGRHAEYIFTDDIVNLRDRLSPAERARTREVYMELQNIKQRGGRIVNTGTPWHRDDAFALMPEPQRWDWRRTGLISESEARALRSSMSPSLFAANYELRHIPEESALFACVPEVSEDIEEIFDGVAHIDAGYGGEDGTAFTVGRKRDGRYYLFGKLWPLHVDRVMPEIAELCEKLRAGPVWMETNADRGYAGRMLREFGVPVRFYRENENKYIKIATHLRRAWPAVTVIGGTDEAYLNQILDYGELSAHDDAPDSAACVCRLLEKMR